ncbi:MAG: hypothetical protein HY754_08325 [Nitrospirae bacterium]|nr:hypothetical protein [Nitrospirota bacterium]
MKESVLKEKLDIIERELSTLSDKITETDGIKAAVEDLQMEIKGLKLFLSRVHPQFKKDFPEIIKKLKG